MDDKIGPFCAAEGVWVYYAGNEHRYTVIEQYSGCAVLKRERPSKATKALTWVRDTTFRTEIYGTWDEAHHEAERLTQEE